ncbi:MAG TPA: response regulator transcription factor [Dermatophilaceae bacterium]|nr:response regulator transcription factor [Dermatophilaceae bacterium]
MTLVLVSDYELVVHGLAKMLAPYESRVRIVDPVGQPSELPVDVALYTTLAADQAAGNDVKARHAVLYTLNTNAGGLADARASGADGVLSTCLGPEDLVVALERVCAGDTVTEVDGDGPRSVPGEDWPGQAAGLSVREAEVIALITQGISNRDIAHTLALSTNTIKSYIRSAYRRMNVTSRSTAILWAVDHGFTRPHHVGRQSSAMPQPRSPAPARERG